MVSTTPATRVARTTMKVMKLCQTDDVKEIYPIRVLDLICADSVCHSIFPCLRLPEASSFTSVGRKRKVSRRLQDHGSRERPLKTCSLNALSNCPMSRRELFGGFRGRKRLAGNISRNYFPALLTSARLPFERRFSLSLWSLLARRDRKHNNGIWISEIFVRSSVPASPFAHRLNVRRRGSRGQKGERERERWTRIRPPRSSGKRRKVSSDRGSQELAHFFNVFPFCSSRHVARPDVGSPAAHGVPHLVPAASPSAAATHAGGGVDAAAAATDRRVPGDGRQGIGENVPR